jgi:hypothetical protein
MEQMAALSFNQSGAGRGIGHQGHGPPPPTAPFAPNRFGRNNYVGRGGQDHSGRGGQGSGRGRGPGRGPPEFIAGRAPPIMPLMVGRAPTLFLFALYLRTTCHSSCVGQGPSRS